MILAFLVTRNLREELPFSKWNLLAGYFEIFSSD